MNPGEVSIVLKHPTNVIVASPTGKAPPPAVGETRVDQLSKALKVWEECEIIYKKFCVFRNIDEMIFLLQCHKLQAFDIDIF